MNLADDILIERFLKNQLSEEEKATFLIRLESDASFKQSFKLEQQLFQTLNEQTWSFTENDSSKEIREYTSLFKSHEIDKLKKILRKENDNYQKSTHKSFRKWILYATAAVIIFFIVIRSLDTKKNTQTLYTTYLATTELSSVTTRGKQQTELANAQTYFENKEYKKALPILEKEMKQQTNLTGSLFIYTGIAQMELNQFDNALKTFNTLINSDLLDAPKGKWFKALLYIKMNDIDKATKILQDIINHKLYNYKKATELLDKLPKPTWQ